MTSAETRFCVRCGGELPAESEQADAHEACRAALALEPPRFCGNCGRKLRVQVVPDGFRARCPVHGDVVSG